MNRALGGFKATFLLIADIVAFFLTTPAGLAVLGSALAVWLAASVWNAERVRSLACAAASKSFGAAEAVLVALHELIGIAFKVAATTPTILAVVLGLFVTLGVADSVRSLDEIQANARRIRELSAVLRNLDQRYRVADVRAVVSDGRTMTVDISFYGGTRREEIVKTQRVTLPGRELFVDAVICNFDYSEIETGRRINLAIPYRVFSDETPQAEGIPLELLDPSGVPHVYRRAPDEVYGLEPESYNARVEELSAILRDNEMSRRNGIVRSLYGSAVHRTLRPGDAFTVWVEQVGGVSLKEAKGF